MGNMNAWGKWKTGWGGKVDGAWRPPRIVEVREGSPCLGLVEEGDLLLAMNGRRPRDILDCLDWGYASKLRLRLRRGDREITCVVRKEEGFPLGLVFDEAVFDGVITCRNRCRFCFVDQMPPGLRPSLYLKDDDYRLSFYHGNFITLNNLDRGEVNRILRMRLAPLYVSLHTTDPGLRSRLMGGDAGRGLEVLRRLLDAGLEVHLQVVCCPGLNDGEALRRTFEDVVRYYPAASLGVVPVGLTGLASRVDPTLRPHDGGTAAAVLDLVEEYQEKALDLAGRRLFFASDEFYLLAGREFPPAEQYEDYPQLENGVGMARKFLEEAGRWLVRKKNAADDPRKSSRPPRESPAASLETGRGVITGVAGEPVIRRALAQAGMEEVEIITVKNSLFGGTVTVTSLLGGRDILKALRHEEPTCRDLLLPNTLLREGRFLDDLTPEDVRVQTGYRLHLLEADGSAFLSALAPDPGTAPLGASGT